LVSLRGILLPVRIYFDPSNLFSFWTNCLQFRWHGFNLHSDLPTILSSTMCSHGIGRTPANSMF
jgi:hypothetical protein